MIKEITKETALKFLLEGKVVWVMNEEANTFGNLSNVFNGRMIADVEADPVEETVSDLETVEEESEEDLEEEPKEESKGTGRVSTIDWGKVRALRRGKWSAKDIADEMDVSVSTIYNYFKKCGDPMKEGY